MNKMYQSMEKRSEAEMAAVSALLHLSGLRMEPNTHNGLFMSVPQSLQHQQQQESYQTGFLTSTPYPTHPKKRVRYLFVEPTQEEQSVDCSGLVKDDGVFSPKSNENSTKTSSTEAPSMQIKSNSGRIIKRTKRFVSQSDDDIDSPTDVRTLPTPGKKSKATNEKNAIKINGKSKDVIHPAKKMKMECLRDVDEQNNNYINSGSSSKNNSGNSGSSSGSKNEPLSKSKHDIFRSNIMKLIQSDEIRHSRLFEAAHELENCTKLDASVEFQCRAIENLRTYRAEIAAKRPQIPLNRLPTAAELMQKFRSLKNRQQICNEFLLKFRLKTSTEWKPFAEDASRLTSISSYKEAQLTKQPLIKFWIDVFVTQHCGKEKARSMLIEILKMLPNRPEVRHEFFNVYLPKVLSAHRQSIKKNKNGASIKNEVFDISAVLPFHF